MNALKLFLVNVENLEPGLFDVLDGDKALRELEILEGIAGDQANTEGYTLIKIDGQKQEIVDSQTIGTQKVKGGWLLEVPVVIVKARRTTPLKEPTTEPEAE